MARKRATPETTLADTSAISASAADESAPAEVADHPTPLEAEGMFESRPSLAAVRTSAGWLTRDGVLTPVLAGE